MLSHFQGPVTRNNMGNRAPIPSWFILYDTGCMCTWRGTYISLNASLITLIYSSDHEFPLF